MIEPMQIKKENDLNPPTEFEDFDESEEEEDDENRNQSDENDNDDDDDDDQEDEEESDEEENSELKDIKKELKELKDEDESNPDLSISAGESDFEEEGFGDEKKADDLNDRKNVFFNDDEEYGDDEADVIYYVALEDIVVGEKRKRIRKQVSKKSDNAPISRVKLNLKDGCPVCGKIYRSEHSLKGHMKVKHLFGTFKCANCDEVTFDYGRELYDHFLNEGCGEALQCPNRKCDRIFQRTEQMNEFAEHYHSHVAKWRKFKAKPAVCDICGKTMSSKHALWRHRNSHLGIKPIKCPDCDFTTTYANSLEDHKTIHLREKGIERFVCDQCGKSFFNKVQMKEHVLNIHEGQRSRHVCPYCGERFTYKSTMNRHRAKYHNPKNAAPTCHLCGYVAGFPHELNKHYAKHMSESGITQEEKDKLAASNYKFYPCEECGFTAGTKNDLNRHMRVHLDGQYPCTFCGKKMKTMKTLLKHEATHSGDNAWNCQQCNEKFKTSRDLNKHKADEHGGQIFYCDKCDHKCYAQHDLARHQASHVDASFPCRFCGKLLKTKKSLRFHELNHTEEGREELAEKKRKKGQEVHCQFCGKLMSSQQAKEDHERLHTGEKPYSCRVCNVNFYSNKELGRHNNQVHSDNPHERKKFTCEICGKICVRSCAYQDHMNGHRGIKAHKCGQCDYRATFRTALYIHRKKHVKPQPPESEASTPQHSNPHTPNPHQMSFPHSLPLN